MVAVLNLSGATLTYFVSFICAIVTILCRAVLLGWQHSDAAPWGVLICDGGDCAQAGEDSIDLSPLVVKKVVAERNMLRQQVREAVGCPRAIPQSPNPIGWILQPLTHAPVTCLPAPQFPPSWQTPPPCSLAPTSLQSFTLSVSCTECHLQRLYASSIRST